MKGKAECLYFEQVGGQAQEKEISTIKQKYRLQTGLSTKITKPLRMNANGLQGKSELENHIRIYRITSPDCANGVTGESGKGGPLPSI